MPLYFAYGSNLLTARIAARCRSARPLGRASLAGYRVGFAKYSWMDGSGKATILTEDQDCAMGVVFELSRQDLDLLDRIEGVGKGYDRIDRIAIETADGPAEAVTYIATDPIEGQRPFDWYLALILAGCLEHNLPAAAIQSFRSQPYDTDTDTHRDGRQKALSALKLAGWALGDLLPSPPGSIGN